MLTTLWLILTTAIGYAVGHYFFPEHVLLATVIGFFIGLVLRLVAGGKGGSGVLDDIGDFADDITD